MTLSDAASLSFKRTRSLTNHSPNDSLTASKPSSSSPGHRTARSARVVGSEYGDFVKASASIQQTSVLRPTVARVVEINSEAKGPMAEVKSHTDRKSTRLNSSHVSESR